MVVLRVPKNEDDVEDQDIGCSWEELAAKQQRGDFGDLSKETVEEGDTLAMLDRNCITEDFTRRVFVHIATAEHVLLFDENGDAIDEPGSFVCGGWQLLRGDHSFLDEWTDDQYYQLGVPPLDMAPQLLKRTLNPLIPPPPPPPPPPLPRPLWKRKRV